MDKLIGHVCGINLCFLSLLDFFFSLLLALLGEEVTEDVVVVVDLDVLEECFDCLELMLAAMLELPLIDFFSLLVDVVVDCCCC